MMTRRDLLVSSAIGLMFGRIAAAPAAETLEVVHSDADWRKLLTPVQYTTA